MEAENEVYAKELYGSHYEKLKNFMTEDGWVLKNIFEINYFGAELSSFFDFKLVNDTWLVRPNFFSFKKKTKEKQIQMVSFNFAFQNLASEALTLFMDKQRESFIKELEINGLSCAIANHYDEVFQKQIISIIAGQTVF
jgi:hypothetical protein